MERPRLFFWATSKQKMAEAVSTEVGTRMIDASAFRVRDSCASKGCGGDNPAGDGRPIYRDMERRSVGASRTVSGANFGSQYIGKDVLGPKIAFDMKDQFGNLSKSDFQEDTRDMPKQSEDLNEAANVKKLYDNILKPLK